MGTRYHFVMDARAALRMSDRKLKGAMRRDGKPMSADEIRELAVECLRKGWDVIPGCDNPDPATGRCAGHEDQRDGISVPAAFRRYTSGSP